MKRHIIIFTAILLAASSAWAATPVAQSDTCCTGWRNFVHNVETYGRLGYEIGGTAPIGMPATIRKLNKFVLQPNVAFGVDAIKPIDARWGVLAGIRFENKGMHIDATVKNYHMKFVQGGQELEGMFTGKNDSKATLWMFTVPVQAVCRLGSKWKLKAGPYFSYLTGKKFEGFAYDGYLRVGDPTGDKVVLGNTDEERGNYDFNGDIRRMQYGFDVGADYMFSQRVGVYADLAWGFSGLFKSSFKVLDQTLYPIYGTIGITYKIR